MFSPKLIVAPVDFSEPSQEALKTAADIAKGSGAELLLVHAVPVIPKLPSATEIFQEGQYEAALHQDAERRLNAMVEDLKKDGVNARAEVGLADEPGMEILRIAEENHAELIVISTHGMTGWHRLVFGSVAEKVVRLAACPVLVLRAQQKAAHEKSSQAHGPVAA